MTMIEVVAFWVGLIVLIYAVVMGAWYVRRPDKENQVTMTARRAVTTGKAH